MFRLDKIFLDFITDLAETPLSEKWELSIIKKKWSRRTIQLGTKNRKTHLMYCLARFLDVYYHYIVNFRKVLLQKSVQNFIM